MPQLTKTIETERHILPSTKGTDDEGWVDLKARVRHGDISAARKKVVKISEADVAAMAGPGGADPRLMASQLAKGLDPGAYPDFLLAQVIVAWNFTDENDIELQITPEAIAMLDEQDADYLWNIVLEKIRGRPLAENGSSERHSSLSSQLAVVAQTTRKQHRR